jgi:hypothetical protein
VGGSDLDTTTTKVTTTRRPADICKKIDLSFFVAGFADSNYGPVNNIQLHVVPMHANLTTAFVCWTVLSCGATSAAQLSMDNLLAEDDVASFQWPMHTVQELSVGERKILIVCKSTGSGLTRRFCFIYAWTEHTSNWFPVMSFRSSTSRVDANYLDGKIVLTSYAGRTLLELTAETMWPYYDMDELKQPKRRGKADEESIERMNTHERGR